MWLQKVKISLSVSLFFTDTHICVKCIYIYKYKLVYQYIPLIFLWFEGGVVSKLGQNNSTLNIFLVSDLC